MGERLVVEVELHSGASFQEVDIHIPIIISSLPLIRLANTRVHFQVNREGEVAKENKEDQQSDSGEDETEVGRIQTMRSSPKFNKYNHNHLLSCNH